MSLFKRPLENESTASLYNRLQQTLLLLLSMLALTSYSWNSTFSGYRLFHSDWEVAAALVAAGVQLLFAVTITRKGGARWLVLAALLGLLSVFGSTVTFYKARAGDEIKAVQVEAEEDSKRAYGRDIDAYGVRVSHAIASVESQAITPIREAINQLELEKSDLGLDVNAEETGVGGSIAGTGKKWHYARKSRARTGVSLKQAKSSLKSSEALFNWVRKPKTPDEQYARLLVIPPKLSVPVVVPEVTAPETPAEVRTGSDLLASLGEADLADLIRHGLVAIQKGDVDAIIAAGWGIILDLLIVILAIILRTSSIEDEPRRLATQQHRRMGVKARAGSAMRSFTRKGSSAVALLKGDRVDLLITADRLGPDAIEGFLKKGKFATDGSVRWKTAGDDESGGHFEILNLLAEGGYVKLIDVDGENEKEKEFMLDEKWAKDVRHSIRSLLLQGGSYSLPQIISELRHRRQNA